ncbi:hypothetical protein CYMTET_26759 [Cymbomonas tetramitiformis]|uniref:Uncharacterized protein n=1 Tax=Cymbomonas tetramitiformis TaxID=36881 RepID=A0AAE0FRN8_9CHLO|nr:hypothetical protein CYMTET_26759 [Cymbomonas tetramitiformis]
MIRIPSESDKSGPSEQPTICKFPVAVKDLVSKKECKTYAKEKSKASVPRKRAEGVPHEFREKFVSYIEAGNVPSRIINKLQIKFSGQPDVIARLLTKAQIENIKREFTRNATGGIKFERVANLIGHTKGLELKETYPVDADINALVVLPDGVFEYTPMFGVLRFCFSARNILENAKRLRDGWGGSFPGETDGSCG